MRLLLAGDTHGNVDHLEYLIRIAHEKMADAIVQVGDWGFTWPSDPGRFERVDELLVENNLPMYWLDGNHDNYTDLKHRGIFDATEPTKMGTRVWYLPRGATWDWGGVRFMSVGGAISIDKARRVRGLSWWPEESLSHDQVRRAKGKGRVADVMLTHDAPAGIRRLERYLNGENAWRVPYKVDVESTAHREALAEIANAVRPRLLVHGHYHHRYLTRAPWCADDAVLGLDRDTRGAYSWVLLDTDRFDGTGQSLLESP